MIEMISLPLVLARTLWHKHGYQIFGTQGNTICSSDFCFFLKYNLERSGKYRVLTAASGLDGIRLARQYKPDLIFLDIMMPGMDGGDVAYSLSEDELTKRIPIVFLTALVTKEEIGENGKYIAGREYIAKPVTTEFMVEKIEHYLAA